VQSGNTGPGSGHNTISEPVTIYVPGSTGTTEFSVATFQLFPNPASGDITLQFPSDQVVRSVSIYNTLGQPVLNLAVPESEVMVHADIRSLQPGLYFVELRTAGGNQVQRLVVR
jgi:hypothetical protein